MAKALTMGDDLHSRDTAASALTALELGPYLGGGGLDRETREDVWGYLRNVTLLFLPLSMAACKATADAAHNVEYSTVAVILCRNGIEYGIQVSGLGRQWFTGPAQPIKGVYFSSSMSWVGPVRASESATDEACRDVGDSAITEAMGLGAFAMAAAPAMVQLKGGDMATAVEQARRLEEITVGRHRHFRIPALENAGTPVGVDIRRVVETGITPLCTTGIAAKNGGHLGTGTSAAPTQPFEKALRAFGRRYLD
jgi:hypothetical protein